MLKLVVGSLAVALGMAVACGDDDAKKAAAGEAGAGAAGGEAGSGAADSGGASSRAGSNGVGTAGDGAGGELGLGGSGGSASSEGGSAGSGSGNEAGSAGTSSGEGGTAGAEASTGGVPSGNDGGAAGAPSGQVSICGEGSYVVGEGGQCEVCPGDPGTYQLSCDSFFGASIVSADVEGLFYARLSASFAVREPFAAAVTISYTNPVQSAAGAAVFRPANQSWFIDLTAGPVAPSTITISPFTATGACGDTYESIDEIRFTRAAGAPEYTQDACAGNL